jgi:lysozyme
MEISEKGFAALVSHEAIVLTRYLDSVLVWTIGIGHTAAAGPPNPKTFMGELTFKEVFDLFRKDLAKFVGDVNDAIKVPLEQHQFDALVSFHFNTGSIRTATMTKTINKGNMALAAEQMMDWKKPASIIGRRTDERDLFRDGKYPPLTASLFPATKEGKILWKKGKTVDISPYVSGGVSMNGDRTLVNALARTFRERPVSQGG